MAIERLLTLLPNDVKIQFIGDGTIESVFGTSTKVSLFTKSELTKYNFENVKAVTIRPIDNNILEIEIII